MILDRYDYVSKASIGLYLSSKVCYLGFLCIVFVFFSSISLFHITLYASGRKPTTTIFSELSNTSVYIGVIFVFTQCCCCCLMGYHLWSILLGSLFNWVYVLLKGIRPNTLIYFHSFMILGKCDYRRRKPFSDFHLYYAYMKRTWVCISPSSFLPLFCLQRSCWVPKALEWNWFTSMQKRSAVVANFLPLSGTFSIFGIFFYKWGLQELKNWLNTEYHQILFRIT